MKLRTRKHIPELNIDNKVREILAKIPNFTKVSLSSNQRIHIENTQMYNHYHYYPQGYIEKQFKIYKGLKKIKEVSTICAFVGAIFLLITILDGYNILFVFKICIFIACITIISQILLTLKYFYISKYEIIEEHYMLNMNPNTYTKQDNKIFFY